MQDFKYNHDLLLDPDDLKKARIEFPNIFPALDHEVLRNAFTRHNKIAEGRKKWSRRIGRASIFLVAFALIVAAASHLYEGEPWLHSVEIASAALGLFGAALGYFGILSRKAKNRWLRTRFLAERIRQFHFQSLILLAPEILAAAQSGDWKAFKKERATTFTTFCASLENALQVKFADAIEDHINGRPAESWALRARQTPPTSHPHLAELLAAYRKFRLIGQRDFAQLKVTPHGGLFSTIPADQVKSIAGMGFYCVLFLVILHLVVAVGGIFGLPAPWAKALHVTAVSIAIAALALRTLDEGLQPAREMARYGAYRDSIRNLTTRFDAAGATSAAFVPMLAMEELSYDEMGSFLRSNEEARFVM